MPKRFFKNLRERRQKERHSHVILFAREKDPTINIQDPFFIMQEAALTSAREVNCKVQYDFLPLCFAGKLEEAVDSFLNESFRNFENSNFGEKSGIVSFIQALKMTGHDDEARKCLRHLTESFNSNMDFFHAEALTNKSVGINFPTNRLRQLLHGIYTILIKVGAVDELEYIMCEDQRRRLDKSEEINNQCTVVEGLVEIMQFASKPVSSEILSADPHQGPGYSLAEIVADPIGKYETIKHYSYIYGSQWPTPGYSFRKIQDYLLSMPDQLSSINVVISTCYLLLRYYYTPDLFHKIRNSASWQKILTNKSITRSDPSFVIMRRWFMPDYCAGAIEGSTDETVSLLVMAPAYSEMSDGSSARDDVWVKDYYENNCLEMRLTVSEKVYKNALEYINGLPISTKAKHHLIAYWHTMKQDLEGRQEKRTLGDGEKLSELLIKFQKWSDSILESIQDGREAQQTDQQIADKIFHQELDKVFNRTAYRATNAAGYHYFYSEERDGLSCAGRAQVLAHTLVYLEYLLPESRKLSASLLEYSETHVRLVRGTRADASEPFQWRSYDNAEGEEYSLEDGQEVLLVPCYDTLRLAVMNYSGQLLEVSNATHQAYGFTNKPPLQERTYASRRHTYDEEYTGSAHLSAAQYFQTRVVLPDNGTYYKPPACTTTKKSADNKKMKLIEQLVTTH